ncbi:MAG TPA: hypothetical protein GX736_02855 [Mogibacterium sp.]|nr:hypothetical protein [Mogibacterium sp.]
MEIQENNIPEKTEDKKEEKKSRAKRIKDRKPREKKKKKTGICKAICRNHRKIAASLLIIGVFMSLFAFAASKFFSLYPYAITVDNQPICYVKNEAAADDALNKVYDEYSKEKTDIKVVSSNKRIKIKKADSIKADSQKIVSSEEAAECIRDKVKTTKKEKRPVEIIVISADTKEKDYIPKPNYEKDKTMLAGEAKIKVKGKKGRQKISITYKSVNGKIVSKEQTAREILDKGSKATIIKGTLGLPEGEDWRTYDGDPVFKDGAELVTTASNYIGKVRYVWGGRSLKTGVSCLGLVKAIYAKYGIYLPMSHPGMKRSGIGVSYSKAQKGDIICYKSHVGIYIGNGKMIDATSKLGVSIRPVSRKKLVTVRRIVR